MGQKSLSALWDVGVMGVDAMGTLRNREFCFTASVGLKDKNFRRVGWAFTFHSI